MPISYEMTYRILEYRCIINDSTPHTIYDVLAFNSNGEFIMKVKSFRTRDEAERFVREKV